MTPSDYSVGALVSIISSDGMVEVFHSGSEIGQGINTKVAQAVAYALGCDMSCVLVGDNCSSFVPNGGCTGGSGTSESCVGACLDACRKIMNTLTEHKETSVDGDNSWQALIARATESADAPLTALGWWSEQPATESGR